MEGKLYKDGRDFEGGSILRMQWYELRYKLDGVLDDITYFEHIEDFLKRVTMDYGWEDEELLMVIPKIRIEGGVYRSLSDMRRVSKLETAGYKITLVDRWRVISGEYESYNISSIIFIFLLGKTEELIERKKEKGGLSGEFENDEEENILEYRGKVRLPKSTDVYSWGEIVKEGVNSWTCKIKEFNWIIEAKKKGGVITSVLKNKHGNIMEWKDKMGVNDLEFIREIEGSTIHYKDGIEILTIRKKKVGFIKNLKVDKGCEGNEALIIGMDIETYLDSNGLHVPYCVSIVGRGIKESYFITDYKGEEEMLTEAVKGLLKIQFDGSYVYFHNFGKFDSIFMIKPIVTLAKSVKPKYKDNLLIELEVKYEDGGKTNTIRIKDSYLILNVSLELLARDFIKGKGLKGIFPHEYVNEDNLSYVGEVPGKEFYKGMNDKEYNEYKKGYKEWNLKEECIKYCVNDSYILHKIMEYYWLHMYNEYSLDINKCPTISSIAIKLYRTHFMNNSDIPIITGGLYKFLKTGYTGGRVDVIKPYGKKVYHYDVNSLYPYTMAYNMMPTGQPELFTGNILEVYPDAFGFFKCNVTAPENMHVPVLQCKHNNLTVSPIGTWDFVYFSEEVKNAIKLGYKVTVQSGVLFKPKNIFKDYVMHFYNIKSKSKSGNPDYMISKLLLNTLYGRFGMEPSLTLHTYTKDTAKFLKENIKNVSHICNGIYHYEIKISSKAVKLLPISIPIAMAVTSYGRIHMSQFITLKSVLYTDTDSIFTSKKLPNKWIGNDLGKWKLEGTYKEAVFLAPKVYATRSNTKDTIKIKGYKGHFTFDMMKMLLYKGKEFKLYQYKWFTNKNEHEIRVVKQVYTIIATENKRHNTYKKNIFCGTKPITIT